MSVLEAATKKFAVFTPEQLAPIVSQAPNDASAPVDQWGEHMLAGFARLVKGRLLAY